MKNKLLLILGLTLCVVYACKKNDRFSGPPKIENIRAIDTLKRDSFFAQAVPGTVIVIQGSNLSGLQAVFFNDTLAYFNPVYATNNNIIVTIPSTAQTKATNPTVPDVIRLVTDHGEISYAFQLYLPPPSIASIALDNSGKVVTINGYNFQGITKITFPLTGGVPDTALSYEVNKTFTQITAVIPDGTPFADSLRVYCTFGTAAYSYPPPMTIASVSNENGAAGTSILINGTNFIGVTSVKFPGGLDGVNLQTISVNQLKVTVPAGIAAADSLHVVGALGDVASPQLFATNIAHSAPGYISTFEVQYATDNTGFVGWTGGYADAPTAATNYPGGTGAAGVIIQSSPMPGNTAAGSQGNAGLLQLNPNPWVANTAQSINGYSMKFEVYVAKPWSAGAIWISLGGWYGWSSYTARYAPWKETGATFQPAGWVTATIPLSQFIKGNEFYQTAWNPAGAAATKFSDYPTTEVGFLIVNDEASPSVPANSLNIAVDNIRIVKGQ